MDRFSLVLTILNNILIHFNIDDINSYEINDSNILFDNGYIYWVDEYIDNIKDIKHDFIYFRGRSLKWKMINKR